jgi:hypothetical protein
VVEFTFWPLYPRGKKVPVDYEGGCVPEPVRRCWRRENVPLELNKAVQQIFLEDSRLEGEERVLSSVINLVHFKLKKNNDPLWVTVTIVLD